LEIHMKTTSLPTIGVIGAGTMGSGIALVALLAGANVILQDPYQAALDKAAEYAKKFLEKKDKGELLANLSLSMSLDGFAKAGVVIEAALEQLELKREIFAKLDAICATEAILATNTSTLSVTAVAATTKHPERVAGMHFFNPAPVLPLVEVVRAVQSSPATVEALMNLATALGKTPVVTGDTPGFIVNRVARPFYGEALRLLGEGVASFENIDKLVEQGGGFRMGPFKLMDLIGIDINTGAMRSMYEQTFGEPRYKPHWIQMQKLAAGELGRKTGQGFYEYRDGENKGKLEGGSTSAEVPKVTGSILVSPGSWAPHLAELASQTGYAVSAQPAGAEAPVAAFVAAGRDEDAAGIVAAWDAALPAEVPLLVQGADISLSEAAAWAKHPERVFAFDGLFLANGGAVAVTAAPGGESLRPQVAALLASLEREAVWVGQSPALVLPRIVCQLVNEASFAVLEGVADASTIDLAMKLGVNYPRGLLEWGAAIGYGKVLAVLDHLYAEYHEERYRASVLLRRWARVS
jgi:3-hydroxybutyryl-CoA dehydrogenase